MGWWYAWYIFLNYIAWNENYPSNEIVGSENLKLKKSFKERFPIQLPKS